MSKMSDDSVNKILVGVLVFLCVAIVGLGMGIGIISIRNSKEESYEKCLTSLDDALASDYNSIQSVIDTYQSCIDIASDDQKVALYSDRASWVASHDFEKEYGSLVIKDAKYCDGVLESQESAADVFNYASYYNNESVMNEYNEIIIQRVEAAGYDYYGGGGEG